MSVWSKKEKEISISGKKPFCKSCETGIAQTHVYVAWHCGKSTLTRFEYMSTMQRYGSLCTACLRNGIRGMKAKALRKIIPSFQTLDNYVKHKSTMIIVDPDGDVPE